MPARVISLLVSWLVHMLSLLVNMLGLLVHLQGQLLSCVLGLAMTGIELAGGLPRAGLRQ